MKFIFGLMFFLCISLLAESKSNSEVNEQKSSYAQAKSMFKQGKYQKAYDKFYALFENNLEDPNINFQLGRSAYMLKEYELAISAYERVLNVDENSIRSNLEIAKCYFELKKYKESKKIFQEVLNKDIPKNVKNNIQTYLGNIESRTIRNFVSGTAIYGINYDTNIYSRANDDSFIAAENNLPPAYGIIQNTTEDASGIAQQGALSVNHLYSYNEKINFKNDILVYAKSIATAHDRDIVLAQYSPALSVIHNSKLLVDYALIFSNIWVGYKPMMRFYGVNPKLKFAYSQSLMLSSSYKYQRKITQNFSADINVLDFSLRKIYSDSITLTLYSQFYSEKKASSNLANIDYEMLNVSISPAFIYSKELTFTPKLQWYTKSFKDINQEDNEYQYLFNIAYSYSPNILFNLDYAYTDHLSTIPVWEFNKQSITTNVILIF